MRVTSPPAKIAVLRANAIGDLLFALPALAALRHAFPKAEITLLGRRWHRDFFRARPSPVDRVIVVPPCKGVNQDDLVREGEDEVRLDQFFDAMRRERFDVAIQIHGGGRYSNPFVKRLGAGYTLGLKSPDAEPLDVWVPYVYLQPETLRYLEVMSLLGVKPIDFTARLLPTARDLSESRAVLPEGTPPCILLNPNAGDPLRRWPIDRFAAVADRLAREAPIVAVGSAEDAARCAELCSKCRNARNVCGRLTLGGLIGLLSRAALLISNDTGPLHLAVALSTPAVGIYWYPNLLTAAPGTRQRLRPVVSWLSHCPECHISLMHGRCNHLSSLLEEVTVEEVLENALQLLQERAVHGARSPRTSPCGVEGQNNIVFQPVSDVLAFVPAAKDPRG